jgi:NAD(P)-dependent dehydrogenase (short-subunit alcohol dehydrogenase family)
MGPGGQRATRPSFSYLVVSRSANMNFSGRTILITGAASGIGLATARALADGGAARLLLSDVDGAALDRLDLPCVLERIAGDVRDEGYWAAVAPHLADLDHAVVGAGVAGGGMIAELALDEWRRVVSVNLDGAFLSLRAAMRAIRDGGSIVLIASAAGVKAEPGIAAYAASKAAVIQLAKVAAKEGAPRGVRVNAIAPAGVETPIWDGMAFFDELVAKEGGRDAAFAARAKLATPLGRYAKAKEIAAQIAFLLSDASAFTTGATLITDGGYTL